MSIKVGLIGQGIKVSRSPAMHETEAERQGFELRYDLFDTDHDSRSLAELLDLAQAAGYSGLNITHPYKQAVVGLLDQLSPTAEQVGAVNTVVFEGETRIGHNTDCPGFAAGFQEGLPDASLNTAVVVGAGGAGFAVANALLDLGVKELLICDRAKELAVGLADMLGGPVRVVTDLSELGPVDGFVNATPMGMASHPGSAIPKQYLTPCHWLVDIVYFPLETQLLCEAKEVGCQCLSGRGMAVHQAALSFELFTNHTADPDQMRETFESFNRQDT
ncbi:MAG: shikimate dehydrogenase [Pelagimonas sp.]|uniref:shikimate dehydrogenase n=1 Tax=Pelagimonas sp. TaxID=2073170 RepID=UPI003D6B38B5